MRLLGVLVLAVYRARWIALPPLVGVSMLAMIIGAVVVAPRESVEGEVQRLFYIHAPSATAMYLAGCIVFLASLVVLWKRDMRFDAVARAAAGVGALFTAIVLATGSIWGHPIWGTWWAWDARLTSTLILLLIYCGYLLARSLADETDEQAARYAAVLAIIGAIDFPIVHMSVQWWRTLHPQPIVTQGALPGSMLAVFFVGLVAICLLAIWLIALRAEAEALATRASELRAAVDRREGE